MIDDPVAIALMRAGEHAASGKRAVRRLDTAGLERLVVLFDTWLRRLHTEEVFGEVNRIVPDADMETFMLVKTLAVFRGTEFCESLERDSGGIRGLDILNDSKMAFAEEFLIWLRGYYNKRTGAMWEFPEDSGLRDLGPLTPHRDGAEGVEDSRSEGSSTVYLSFDRALERLPMPTPEDVRVHVGIMPVGAYVRLENADGLVIGEVRFAANRVYHFVVADRTADFTVSPERAAQMLAGMIPDHPGP